MKGRIPNAYLLNLLARAQVKPWLWKPEQPKVNFFQWDLVRLYPHLHFWGESLHYRAPPVVSCLTCCSVHDPGHTICDFYVLQCKNCPGEWIKLPYARKMGLERVAKQLNWFMSKLCDREYNYYVEEVLRLWLVSTRN